MKMCDRVFSFLRLRIRFHGFAFVEVSHCKTFEYKNYYWVGGQIYTEFALNASPIRLASIHFGKATADCISKGIDYYCRVRK